MFCLQVLFMLKDKRNRFTLRGKFLSSKSSDLKNYICAIDKSKIKPSPILRVV